MRYKVFTVHFILVVSFLFLLSSCTPAPSLQTSLIVYRFEPPAFLEYSENLQLTREIPFSIPISCGLFDVFPAPVGSFILIELSCPNGQTVLFMDVETGSTTQPVTSSDAHFLAWTSDGKAAYLKVDSLGSPQILRVFTEGKQKNIPIPEFTYDLSVNPVNDDFTFTLSRGLGYGSELRIAQYAARNTRELYSDPYNYISFARFSPDGKQIAFIKTPDSQTPFTVGELWMIEADGSNPRKLSDVDAGHGYAANWSPDGKQIAFVMRENPEDENANQSSGALISNIYIVDVENRGLTQVTHFTEGYVETPYWSPNGNTLAFMVVINGRMTVFMLDVATGELMPIETDIAPLGGSTCCPAWMRK